MRQHLKFINPDALDRLGMSALHYAALGRNENIMKMLLKSRCNVNVRDHHDATPLHVAANSGNEVMKDLLIASGADQTLTDWNGFTAEELLKKAKERERKNANYRN